MGYLRAKISDLLEQDTELPRWRVTHGLWVSEWQTGWRAEVFEPPVPYGVIAPAYIELDRPKGIVVIGPYNMPTLYPGDSVVFEVILH